MTPLNFQKGLVQPPVEKKRPKRITVHYSALLLLAPSPGLSDIPPALYLCDALIYRTRDIISRSRFKAALVYKPRILSFKKESRNNGRSET